MRFSKLIMGTDLGQSPVLSLSARKLEKSEEYLLNLQHEHNQELNNTNLEFQREVNAQNWEHQQQAWNFQREREGVANQWAIDAEQREDARYWERLQDERAYNDPAAQMQRLRNAGLNPFLNGDSLGSAGAGSGGPSGAAGASHAGTTSGAGSLQTMEAFEAQGIDFNSLASLMVADKQLLQDSFHNFGKSLQDFAMGIDQARNSAAQRDIARAEARKFYSDSAYSDELSYGQRIDNFKNEMLRDATISSTIQGQRLQNQQLSAAIAKTDAETEAQRLENMFNEKTMPVRGQQLVNNLNQTYYQTQLIKAQIQTEGFKSNLVQKQTELVVKEIEEQLQRNKALSRENKLADLDAQSDYGVYDAGTDGNPRYTQVDSSGKDFYNKVAEAKMQNLVNMLEELYYSGTLTAQNREEMHDIFAWIGRMANRMGVNLVFGGSYSGSVVQSRSNSFNTSHSVSESHIYNHTPPRRVRP